MQLMLNNLDKNIIEKIGLSDKNILLFYKGIMNNNILSVFTRFIETQTMVFPKVTRKINRVLIELAQNISYYSIEKSKFKEENRGVGIIVVKELPNSFLLISGNKIQDRTGQKLLKHCNYINSLNINKLKEFKIQQRIKSGLRENRSNIGLVQVALITSNPIEPEIIKENEVESFYILKVKFSKF